MRYNMLFCLMLCLTIVMAGGCGQTTKWPDQTTSKPSVTTQPALPTTFSEKYNDYLLIMDDSQRSRFFKLESDPERERFIESEGIQQKKYLDDHLTVGMSADRVAEVLGRPLVNEVIMDVDQKSGQWVYNSFNGYRNVKYMVTFKNDLVTGWRVWLS